MKLINGIKNKKTYWIFAILCAALWGSGTIGLKLAYAAFGIAPDNFASLFLMMGIRFMLAGVLTELLFGVGTGKLLYPQNRAAWGHTVLLSLTQIAFLYGIFSIGSANATGTMVSMVNGMSTFFTILFATLVFRYDKMDGRKALACVLGFSAVVIMNFNGMKGPLTFTLRGEGALLISQLLAGLSHNITKRFTKTDDPAMLTAWQNFIGGLLLALVGYFSGGRLLCSGKGVALLAYLAFVSGAAFSVWGMLMKHHSVSRINIFMLANPLFGVLFSALILGETAQAFSLRTLAAFLLISAGILLINLPSARSRKTSA